MPNIRSAFDLMLKAPEGIKLHPCRDKLGTRVNFKLVSELVFPLLLVATYIDCSIK